MSQVFYMPMRREETAPTFDKSKTHEFPRYFGDLERLFKRANITNEVEMKKLVLRYVDIETEHLWKTLPEFCDTLATYAAFKEAILSNYPDAYGDSIYSIYNLEALICDRQQLGIASPKELSDFHLQFSLISSWLMNKQQLTSLEQQRAYMCAFQPQLLTAINNRLQFENPRHHPTIPYYIKEVFDAAHLILQQTCAATQEHYAAPQATPPRSRNGSATAEDYPASPRPINHVSAVFSFNIAPPCHVYSSRAPATLRATPSSAYESSELYRQNRIAAIEAELASLRASKHQVVSKIFSLQHGSSVKNNTIDDMRATRTLKQVQQLQKRAESITPVLRAPLTNYPSASTKIAGSVAPTSPNALVLPRARPMHAEDTSSIVSKPISKAAHPSIPTVTPVPKLPIALPGSVVAYKPPDKLRMVKSIQCAPLTGITASSAPLTDGRAFSSPPTDVTAFSSSQTIKLPAKRYRTSDIGLNNKYYLQARQSWIIPLPAIFPFASIAPAIKTQQSIAAVKTSVSQPKNSNSSSSACQNLSEFCAPLYTPSSSIPICSNAVRIRARSVSLNFNQIQDPAATPLLTSSIASASVSDSFSTSIVTTGNQSILYLTLGALHSNCLSSGNLADAHKPIWLNTRKLLPVALGIFPAVWKPPDKLRAITHNYRSKFEDNPTVDSKFRLHFYSGLSVLACWQFLPQNSASNMSLHLFPIQARQLAALKGLIPLSKSISIAVKRTRKLLPAALRIFQAVWKPPDKLRIVRRI